MKSLYHEIRNEFYYRIFDYRIFNGTCIEISNEINTKMRNDMSSVDVLCNRFVRELEKL
jgi:hypothetical protein